MPTINQLVRKGRHSKMTKSGSPVPNYTYNSMEKKMSYSPVPQMCGVAARVGTMAPKKPNPASYRYARVRLSNLIEVTAYIPDVSRSLQEHSVVLIRGGRVKSFPGVCCHIIHGALDAAGVDDRKRGRSKYSAKRD